MGSTWPYLPMYGSHDMRHTGFRKLTVVNGTPRDLGRHIYEVCGSIREIFEEDCHAPKPSPWV